MGAHLQSDAVLLRAERLGRCVPGKILVAGGTFDVCGGELAIVGPSGSGKTSLLRVFNRLDEPTSGTVFFNGADYRQLAPRDLRRGYLIGNSIRSSLDTAPSSRTTGKKSFARRFDGS
jgi:ABC-type proline/glycine betaine transport system ATPase subunit